MSFAYEVHYYALMGPAAELALLSIKLVLPTKFAVRTVFLTVNCDTLFPKMLKLLQENLGYYEGSGMIEFKCPSSPVLSVV